MSIMFADDFNGYGQGNSGSVPAAGAQFLLDGLWGDVRAQIVTDPDVLATGNVLRLLGGAYSGARRPFAPGAVATAGVALRMYMPQLPYDRVGVIGFYDGALNVQINANITPTGAVEIWRGSSAVGSGGVKLGQTTGPVTTANAWHHYELKVVCDAFAGTVELRIDGVSVIALTAVNTGTASQLSLDITDRRTGTPLFNFGCYFKDLVTWNGLGTQNNNFLGTVSVLGMVPNADVNVNWTPSTGTTAFNLLDNSPPLDATEYLTAVTPPPAALLVALSNLPANVTSVRAMIAQVRARKADGGDGNIQASLKSNVSFVAGSDRPITTAFTYYEDVFEVDPNTAAPWTPASADAAQLRINRTI